VASSACGMTLPKESCLPLPILVSKADGDDDAFFVGGAISVSEAMGTIAISEAIGIVVGTCEAI
jgi:hypothetical protein